MLPPPARFATVSPSALLAGMRARMRKRRERTATAALLDTLQTLRRLAETHDAAQMCARAPFRTRRACSRLRDGEDYRASDAGAVELRKMCSALTRACEEGRRSA